MSFPNPGGHASKKDYRSEIVFAAMADSSAQSPSLPIELFTDFQKLGGAMMQSQTPSCVSHAMAQLTKLWWYAKTGNIVDFSPRFLHVLSAYSGAGPNDGRDPVTVAKVSQGIGCATSATCPNDVTLSNYDYCNPNSVTQVARDEAAQYRIPGFVQIPVNQNAVRQAIQRYGAVSILFRIGSELWTAKDGTQTWDQAAIDPMRPPAIVIGGHELVGSGFNGSLDHVVNSWSKLWAQDGESDYLWNEWQPYIVEVLAIADVPMAALQTVRSLPPPDEFKHVFAQNVAFGQINDEVRALQIALTIDGENAYPEITGYYGSATEKAVLAFQTKYAVAPQSTLNTLAGRNVGPATRAKLNQIFGI